MPAFRKGSVVFFGVACICILYIGFWTGLGKYSQIDSYQRWFSCKISATAPSTRTVGVTGSNRTVGVTGSKRTVGVTGSNRTVGVTGSNRTVGVTGTNRTGGGGPGSLKNPELNNQTREINNVTLYVTSDNIWHGRLGNQMFKYASILGISRKQGREMFIEHDTDLEKTFKLKYVLTNESVDKWSTIREANPVAFDARMMNLTKEHTRIDGFLQAFVYFDNVVDEVRQEFTFHDYIANDAAHILRNICVNYNATMTVGVHVRRGDFLSDYGQYWGYGVPDKSYFTKAFSLLKSKFPERKIIFLVASDDLPWCLENLKRTDVFVLPEASAAVHLAVLSSCDHVIISGGTFGWWIGWLANGYVVFYKGYMGKGTPLGEMLTSSTYYPRLWIELGN